MILRIKRNVIWALFTTLFLLPAQFALSSETTSKESDEAEGMPVAFKITSPVARNPLPADILDRMRKELMALMGVEPEESAEPAKKSGH